MAKLNSGTRIYGTATVDSTLAVTGATTLSSTLAVGATTITGAATVSTTLGVTGAATLSSTLAVTGAATLSSTLAVTGAATLSSTLAVTGISSFAAGSAAAPSITRTGDLDTGVYFPAANALGLSTGGTNAVYIDSSQNVGIGTSSPATKLDVSSTTAAATFTTTQTSGTAVKINVDGGSGTPEGLRVAQGIITLSSNAKLINVVDTAGGSLFNVLASGNVGIGTNSPNAKLVVIGNTAKIYDSSTSNANLQIRNSTTGDAAGFTIQQDGVNTLLYNNSNGYMAFAVNATERARITAAGALLMGQSSTANPGGDGNSTTGVAINADGTAYFSKGGNTAIQANTNGTGNRLMGFAYQGTVVAAIDLNGTTGVTYATSSDYRLKNTIAPMTGALAKVALLKPCTYKWNIDSSNGEGFIAHELAEVCPYAVTGEKDAVNKDGSIKSQGIDTSYLVATLTAAIQEQQVLIQDQKVLIQSLITRLTALEAR